MVAGKCHVLHVIGSKKSGGAETFFLRLVEAQHLDDRFEVTCLVRKGSWLEDKLREKDIPVLVAPFRKYFDFQTKSYIENVIHTLPIDLIQGWMNRGSSKLPVTNIPTLGRMGGYYKLKNYNACHVIGGNTIKICEYLLTQGLSKEEITYLPNFAKEPVFVSDDKAISRASLNIPDDAKIALLAGRLHLVKGIDVAIESIVDLENVHLLVLGEGAEEALLKTQAEVCGIAHRVHFLGWKDCVSAYANLSDIWLAPSRHEPLGNIVLDAWMHKIPLIATESDGPRSLVEDGVDGILVPIDSPQALSYAIKELIDDPKKGQKLIKSGYDKVSHSFSREVVLKHYAEVYSDMVSNDGWVSKCAFKSTAMKG